MNAVPCLAWVKRGAAKRLPDRIKLGEAELSSLVKNFEGAAIDESDSSDDEERAKEASGSGKRKRGDLSHANTEEKSDDENGEDSPKKSDTDRIEDEYGLDNYDESSDDEDNRKGLGLDEIAYYSTNKDDPNMAKDHKGDDTDEEDIEITEEDNMIACGKMVGDYFNLEIYVYNENDNNLYCHTDTILGTFPLCMEWLDFDPGEDTSGNMLAVGSMEPDIELWDLDVMGSLEPAYVLAGAPKKNKGKKKKKSEAAGHTDAVLDLSWNALQRNILASASADFTIGLWDLENGKIASSLHHHKEKVQTIHWHPFEAQTLLSGSFDHTAKVYDCRSPDSTHKTWTLPGEVERVLWNHHDPYYFFATSDTGHMYYMDVRTEKPVFTLSAHSGAVSGLALSSKIPGCLLTSSDDKVVKVWDIGDQKPKLVHSQELKIGALHCAAPCPDSGLIFAIGGERELRCVNLMKNPTVTGHFGIKTTETAGSTMQSLGSKADEIVSAGFEKDEEEEKEFFGESSAQSPSTSVNAKENSNPTTASSKKKKKKNKKKKGSSSKIE